MKTETYCTSAGCMQWRAADGLPSRCLQQCRSMQQWCTPGMQGMLQCLDVSLQCRSASPPPTAVTAVTAGCNLPKINIFTGSDDWDAETESWCWLLLRVRRGEVRGTRMSVEHSPPTVPCQLCQANMCRRVTWEGWGDKYWLTGDGFITLTTIQSNFIVYSFLLKKK